MMKDIKDYEGLYAATEEGQIWSYKSNRFLTLCQNKGGYCVVKLSKNGVLKSHYVHRLIAETFIPNPENKPEVNHIREFEKWNNAVSNLEWATRKENNNHGTHNERVAKAHHKKAYCVELDRVFNSATEAAKEMGVNINAISAACRNQKTSCGYHWRYIKEN